MACPEIAIHSDLSELAASVVHVRPATLLCMAAWEPIYRELCSLRLLVTRSGKAKNMNPAILGQLTGASENLANIKTLLPNMTRAITMTFATTHSSQEQIRSTWLQSARGIMTDVSKDVLVAISGPVEKAIAQLEASYAELVEPERNIKAAVEDGSDEDTSMCADDSPTGDWEDVDAEPGSPPPSSAPGSQSDDDADLSYVRVKQHNVVAYVPHADTATCEVNDVELDEATTRWSFGDEVEGLYTFAASPPYKPLPGATIAPVFPTC